LLKGGGTWAFIAKTNTDEGKIGKKKGGGLRASESVTRPFEVDGKEAGGKSKRM